MKHPVPSRIDHEKRLRLCVNCLGKDHNASTCRLGPCRKCKTVKHNSLLHQDRQAVPGGSNQKQVQALFSSLTHSTLLSTASVVIRNGTRRDKICRPVLDSGSQTNYITESLCRRLKLSLTRANLTVSGINGIKSEIQFKCLVTIKSRITDFSHTLECFVLPSITGKLPNNDIDISDWNIPDHIPLADPEFYLSKCVDLLIGVCLFWDLLIIGKITLSKRKPVLDNSVLGWIVSGSIQQPNLSSNYCNISREDADESLRQCLQLF